MEWKTETTALPLRDILAVVAMHAMLSRTIPPFPSNVVKDAYYYADKMIKARSGERNE